MRHTIVIISILALSLCSLPALKTFAAGEGQITPIPCLQGSGPLLPGQVYCGEVLRILGVDLDCYPSLPPDDTLGNGCGLDDFITLLRGVINYLTILIIPLAAAMFAWGGLAIMTAAGSAERVGKGKQIITTALIGVAIALGAWLIINTIWLALRGVGVNGG